MIVETKNDLASRVKLSKEFASRENSPFKTVEHHKSNVSREGDTSDSAWKNEGKIKG